MTMRAYFLKWYCIGCAVLTEYVATYELRCLIEKIIRWTKCILVTFSSGHFSQLKSFSLLVPGRRFERLEFEFDKSRKQEAESLRDQIREFKESMKCLCESAGIECSLDL